MLCVLLEHQQLLELSCGHCALLQQRCRPTGHVLHRTRTGLSSHVCECVIAAARLHYLLLVFVSCAIPSTCTSRCAGLGPWPNSAGMQPVGLMFSLLRFAYPSHLIPSCQRLETHRRKAHCTVSDHVAKSTSWKPPHEVLISSTATCQ